SIFASSSGSTTNKSPRSKRNWRDSRKLAAAMEAVHAAFLRQKKYAGTPSANNTAATSRFSLPPGLRKADQTAFKTMAAAAATKTMGVKGYPGTRYGISLPPDMRRIGNIAAAPNP